MLSNMLYENYLKSLRQKYNAVCFDIDGTLTEPESKKIDNRALEMIYKLLKKKVPVVFITGRGETGLNDLVKDIVIKLKDEESFDYDYLDNLYALTNDGARLFTTDVNSKKIFAKDEYLTSIETFEQLNNFNNKFVEEFNNSELYNYCKITYSRDLKTNRIINIRIMITSDAKALSRVLLENINTLLSNYEQLNVTLGEYEKNQVVQIGTAKKSEAIKKTEEIIGIPENSMLRIGDCGDLTGNDFSMLDCPQGFSVNKISGKEDRCFPIIDENGNVIKGIDGTVYLINHTKILTTVCLEKPNKQIYTKEFAKVEKKIIFGKNELLTEYNNTVKNNFNLSSGINDLFDEDTGSIKIPMYEWELIDFDNPLKGLWSIKNDESLKYCLRDNNSYLLRGSATYYHFLAKRENMICDENNVDLTSFDMVEEWFENYFNFIICALDAIDKTTDFNDVCNKKMILGIIDNMRNYYLVIMNYYIKKLADDKTVLLNLEKANNEEIQEKYYYLLEVDELIAKLCLEKEFSLSKIKVLEMLKNNLSVIGNDRIKFREREKKENYSKDFRAYREIDNFLHNYINSVLSKSKLEIDIDNISFCGLCYGGLELPIIFKILSPEVTDVNILCFNKNVSGYSRKQNSELRTFDINNSGGINLVGIDRTKKTVLMDDNMLTGKSIQLASNIMCDLGIEVEKVSIVKYPSTNRIDQMFLPNHGAVNYKQFFNYIVGLTFPSPYSWRDKGSQDMYEDSLGIFDLNRKKVIECLIKNCDYSEKSEVAKHTLLLKK